MGSAQLRLRDGERLVVWPKAAAEGLMILLVDAGDTAHGEYICRSLSDALGVVSLSVPCAGAADGATAIEWTADHAAQLGAGGARLLLAGLHGAAAAAAALALRARDSGWPDVARQLLIHPRLGSAPPTPLAGVAPATIVGRDAYAARLRQAGIEVDELDHPDPFLEPSPRPASADALLRRLATRLR